VDLLLFILTAFAGIAQENDAMEPSISTNEETALK